jgi:hypothetical protein
VKQLTYLLKALLAVSLAAIGTVLWGQDDPGQLLRDLDEFPHAQRVAQSESRVLDHEIGLGAMRKIRGVWQYKHSERATGLLTRYTWQIVDGFTSQEVLQGLVARVEAIEGSELLFQCEGRACGSGAQWANRAFRQRVLYGREDLQRYRVYSMAGGEGYRMAIYGAARTADRQYLHVELLAIGKGAD